MKQYDQSKIVTCEGISYTKFDMIPVTGKVISQFSNGVLKTEKMFNDGSVFSEKEWYESGQLKIKRGPIDTFGNSKNFQAWHEDGQLKSDGKGKVWYEDGQLKSDGKGKEWYESGNLKRKINPNVQSRKSVYWGDSILYYDLPGVLVKKSRLLLEKEKIISVHKFFGTVTNGLVQYCDYHYNEEGHLFKESFSIVVDYTICLFQENYYSLNKLVNQKFYNIIGVDVSDKLGLNKDFIKPFGDDDVLPF